VETPTWLSEGEDKVNPELGDSGDEASNAALLSSTNLIPAGHKLFNSGATQHLTPYHSLLTNYSIIAPKAISTANKHSFNVIGCRSLKLDIPNGKSTTLIMLKEVLHALDITATLISVGHIDQARYSATAKGSTCTIFNVNRHTVGLIPAQNGLYKIEHRVAASDHALLANPALTIMDLHWCMGHIAPEAAKWLIMEGLITRVSLNSGSKAKPCDTCTYTKMACQPVSKEHEGEKSKEVSGKVHTDIWGLSPIKILGNKSYYVSFTDDKTCYTQTYSLALKSDTFEAYLKYEAWLHTQHDVTVKMLCSDYGGKYLSTNFSNHLANQGTLHRLTVHNMPEKNGVSERLN